MSPKKMPFSKDEYYQMLDKMLMPALPQSPAAGNPVMDQLRQAAMSLRPAATAIAGTAV